MIHPSKKADVRLNSEVLHEIQEERPEFAGSGNPKLHVWKIGHDGRHRPKQPLVTADGMQTFDAQEQRLIADSEFSTQPVPNLFGKRSKRGAHWRIDHRRRM